MVLPGGPIATAVRTWRPQALLPIQPRFGINLSRSIFYSSKFEASRQLHQKTSLSGIAGGVGRGPGRLDPGAELRPYKTVVPAVERLVVIGDVHGDIGDDSLALSQQQHSGSGMLPNFDCISRFCGDRRRPWWCLGF